MLARDSYTFGEAQRKYGATVEKHRRFLLQCDPLADAVVAAFSELPAGRGRRMLDAALDRGIDAVPDAPAALRHLFDQVDDVPFWVDWDRLDRGGATYLRSGIFGMVALSLYSLPLTYTLSTGNKPLVFTGQLVRRAPRRLAETARFVVTTCQPGGLQRFGDGFKVTVKVRLMHAQVRRLLWRSGRWDNDQWGEPINQSYMAATNVALSLILLDGLRRLGFRLTHDEREALLHLWRYSGYLSGVDDELLCATEAEAWRLLDLILNADGVPDRDSQALVEALMDIHILPQLQHLPWMTDIHYGVSRALLGNWRADALRYPRTAWRLVLPVVRPLITVGDSVQRLVPGGRGRATALGARTWNWVIAQHLAGARVEFQPPEQMDHQAVGRRSHEERRARTPEPA